MVLRCVVYGCSKKKNEVLLDGEKVPNGQDDCVP